jgi:hypothetical protein
MRLIVVIGYPEDSRTSKPFPVYAGRDSAEADKAMAESQAVVFEIIRNPTTVRKRKKAVAPAPVVEPTAEESSVVEEEPVVAEAPPAQPDVQPSSGVSGKRGRAA